MKIIKTALLVTALIAGTTSAYAAPPVKGDVPHEVVVDISEQTMTVYLNGKVDAVWPVSTARRGKYTPRGSWSPNFLSKYHKSSRYNNAPMPNSIFYSGNYAIHGTDQEHRLGNVASAGCVRIARAHSKILFDRVERDGMKSFRVTVQD